MDNYNSQKIDIIETLNEFVSTFTNMGLGKEQIQAKISLLHTIILADLEEEDIEEFFGNAAVQIPEILYDLYDELFELVDECPSNGLPVVENFSLPTETN